MEKTVDDVLDIDGRVVAVVEVVAMVEVDLAALAALGEVSDEEGPGHREHRPGRRTPDNYTKNCTAAVVVGQTEEQDMIAPDQINPVAPAPQALCTDRMVLEVADKTEPHSPEQRVGTRGVTVRVDTDVSGEHHTGS